MDIQKANRFVAENFLGHEPVLQEITEAILKFGMPNISINPQAGRLLTILCSSVRAKHVLEIGSLAGYSGVCLTQGMPEDGEFVALELNPDYARIAEGFVRKAGFQGDARFLVGPAIEGLRVLKAEGRSFDFVFIDADKELYPDYLMGALDLSHEGTLITADNALWKGTVFEPGVNGPDAQAMRMFNRILRDHPRLESTVLAFGDGFAVALVKG